MQKLFLVRDSLVALFKVSLGCGLRLLKLLSLLIDLTGALSVKLGIVALKSVHLALQASLFLTLDHTSLLVFDLTASHRRLKLLLLLVQVLFRLVQMATQGVAL